MIAAGVNARTDPLAWKVVALVAIVSPVLEEIVFRGGLQTALLTRPLLRRACWGITGANLLTSIAFAAVHLISQPPLWALLIVLPSLVFGWALERHNTLLSPIGLHVFYNSGFIILFQ